MKTLLRTDTVWRNHTGYLHPSIGFFQIARFEEPILFCQIAKDLFTLAADGDQ
jgi:hypothetical protein